MSGRQTGAEARQRWEGRNETTDAVYPLVSSCRARPKQQSTKTVGVSSTEPDDAIETVADLLPEQRLRCLRLAHTTQSVRAEHMFQLCMNSAGRCKPSQLQASYEASPGLEKRQLEGPQHSAG